jgi:hypothetical protein
MKGARLLETEQTSNIGNAEAGVAQMVDCGIATQLVLDALVAGACWSDNDTAFDRPSNVTRRGRSARTCSKPFSRPLTYRHLCSRE